MKFPKFLPDGGTIGFVAPSFGCATSPYQETFEHAQKRFTELGYRLDLGPNCYESSGVGIQRNASLGLQTNIGMKFGGVNGRLHGNMKPRARK